MRSEPSSAGFEALWGRLEGSVRRFAFSLSERPESAFSEDLQQEMWIAILQLGPGHTDSYYLSTARKAAQEYKRQFRHQMPKREKQPAPATAEQQEIESALKHYDLDVVENLDWTPCTSKAVRPPFTTDEIADYRPYDPTWVRCAGFGTVSHHWVTLGAVRHRDDEAHRIRITQRLSYHAVPAPDAEDLTPLGGRGRFRFSPAKLRTAIADMPAPYRVLAHELMEGRDSADIVKRMKVSERTYRRRIKALREKLRPIVGQ
jgi:DNA-directed RNA polymerase specialized sigma24 family protein